MAARVGSAPRSFRSETPLDTPARSADSPTDPAARLQSLDVLRGAALLGVLVENAQHFFSPSYRELVALPGARLADQAAVWLIEVACENKVYALFALLFGYGIALQMARTGAKDAARQTEPPVHQVSPMMLYRGLQGGECRGRADGVRHHDVGGNQ